jgi:hypothetical protein
MAHTPPPSSSGDEDRPVADAASLFGDEPASRKTPTPSPATPSADPGETYGVAGGDVADEEAESRPIVPPVPPPPPRQAAPRPKPEATRSRRPAEPTATVDQVWTRWGEWGPDVIRVAMAAMVVGGLVVGALMLGWLNIAFFLLMLGGAGLLVLCYPMFITLERPVRMTPEQAINDYYAALSHIRPHYRRMWLLLSSAGRRPFASFEAFCDDWEKRRETLRGGKGGRYSPMTFEVEQFRAERSAGLTATDATFTLRITLHGEPEPLAVVPMLVWLVKGPDRMWYLNEGTLSGHRD